MDIDDINLEPEDVITTPEIQPQNNTSTDYMFNIVSTQEMFRTYIPHVLDRSFGKFGGVIFKEMQDELEYDKGKRLNNIDYVDYIEKVMSKIGDCITRAGIESELFTKPTFEEFKDAALMIEGGYPQEDEDPPMEWVYFAPATNPLLESAAERFESWLKNQSESSVKKLIIKYNEFISYVTMEWVKYLRGMLFYEFLESKNPEYIFFMTDLRRGKFDVQECVNFVNIDPDHEKKFKQNIAPILFSRVIDILPQDNSISSIPGIVKDLEFYKNIMDVIGYNNTLPSVTYHDPQGDNPFMYYDRLVLSYYQYLKFQEQTSSQILKEVCKLLGDITIDIALANKDYIVKTQTIVDISDIILRYSKGKDRLYQTLKKNGFFNNLYQVYDKNFNSMVEEYGNQYIAKDFPYRL